MKYIYISLFLISIIIPSVFGFTIEQINEKIGDSYQLDLQADKVNLNLKTQERVIINGNGKSVNGATTSFIDGSETLNLEYLDSNNVEDNSQQGESTEKISGSKIPANYDAINESIIKRNVQRKIVSFKMKYYEDGVIHARNSVSRYYNKDVTDVLRGGVPSTFGFGGGGISSSIVDNTGLKFGDSSTTSCSQTCNCGAYYKIFSSCKVVPKNGYSTGNSYQCNSGYYKSSGKCLLASTGSANPYNTTYKGIDTSTSNPYGVSIKEEILSNAGLKLGVIGDPYSSTVIKYKSSIGSTCGIYESCVYKPTSPIYNLFSKPIN